MRTIIKWGMLIVAIVVAANFLLPLTGMRMPHYACGYTDGGFLKCQVRWD